MCKIMESISLIWQLPLSVLSFIFYRFIRYCLRKVVNKAVKCRLKRGDSIQWLGLSEVSKQPMGLAYIMVTGPRWNCHALIGILGPLYVKSNIDIQIETAHRSSKQWTLVIYNIYHQTVAFIGSMNTTREILWHKINLEEGQYSIGLRYYDCEHDAGFPAVKIDGLEDVAFRSMEDEMNQYQKFLTQIKNYHGFFYYCLHYYVFHLLRWKKWFPESFVKREFLPVGNPETSFNYGCLRKGDTLRVDFEKDLLENAHIYVAYNNTCSFPVFWGRINQADYCSKPVPCDGFYLIRVLHKTEVKSDIPSNKIHCKIINDKI